MKSEIEIVVIHDNIREHSYLLTELKEHFNTVTLIDDPDTGIQYIKDHYAEKIIIILDIDFGDDVTNGYEVLNKIRERSFLIEVIILSASDLPTGNIFDRIPQLLGLKAFDYVVRKSKWEDLMIKSVFKAKEKIDNSISGAIEQWIDVQARDRRERAYLVTHDGKQYSLNELKKEIYQRTEAGLQLEKKILMMAIKLMMAEKKN